MLTLMLRDLASLKMSFFINIVWLLVYVIAALFDFKPLVSALLYAAGVYATYVVLARWNRMRTGIVLSREQFRVIVKPDTTGELAVVNFYRLPFFFLIWVPTSAGFILFGGEMIAEVGLLSSLAALFLSQLVLFNFINLEIRSRVINLENQGK